jgi:hypothetical protein
MSHSRRAALLALLAVCWSLNSSSRSSGVRAESIGYGELEVCLCVGSGLCAASPPRGMCAALTTGLQGTHSCMRSRAEARSVPPQLAS